MLKKLTNRVYYKDYVQESDRPVLGLIVGDNGCLVVDGGNSKAHAAEFLEEIAQLHIPTIQYLALTHWHWDHIFGVTTIGATTLVEERTNEQLKKIEGYEWTNEELEKRVETGEEIQFCYDHILVEMPESKREIDIPKGDIIYKNELTVDLGGVTVSLQHVGGDHSHDSVVVHVEEEKVLFVGDCLYLDMYHGEWSYSREKLFSLLDRLEKFDANYYVPCHHDLYTNKSFKDFKQYITEIGEAVGDLKDLDEAIQQLEKVKGRALTDDEKEDAGVFVAGNKKEK